MHGQTEKAFEGGDEGSGGHGNSVVGGGRG